MKFISTLSTNKPLVSEVGRGYNEPDYTVLWVALGFVGIAALVLIGVLIYRNWRKNNCCPVYFAGKVKYARKGETIRSACSSSGFEADWLIDQKYWLRQQGKTIVALYTDPALTIPLNEDQIVTAPVHIFPKLQK